MNLKKELYKERYFCGIHMILMSLVMLAEGHREI